MVAALFFYLFAAVTVASAVMVITARNPVHSVLFLILCFFNAAGLVLLVAMVGAIVLTLRHKEGVKRQNISDQVARTPATAIEVIKVKPGQGI